MLITLLAGCGKSPKDVAGVYETKEIKTPLSPSWHHSSKWILDLSEAGTFTLTNEVFRVPTQDKKYSPILEKGLNETGEWRINGDSITLTWQTTRSPHKEEEGQLDRFGYPIASVLVIATISAQIQSNGDLVMGEITLSKFQHDHLDPLPWDFYGLPTYDIQMLRFSASH